MAAFPNRHGFPMEARNALPSITVVIEWENARLSELDRARRMLDALLSQNRALADRLAAPTGIVLVHDRNEVDPETIRQCLAGAAAPGDDVVADLAGTDGLSYYEQKNFGARRARSELVVFLDSDVVPEPGWLEGLIEPFRDPAVEAVCGNAFVEPVSLYSKAFSLWWVFRCDPERTGLEPTERFYANNVAFRTALFLRHGFPPLPTFRGQCVRLARSLREAGVTILRQHGARVSHPPPNGIGHFVKRALCHGHDIALAPELFDDLPGTRPALRPFLRWVRSCREAAWHTRTSFRRARLSPAGAVAATGIAVAFYTLFLAGELLSKVAPAVVRRRFAI
jgi:Glycosyl transferase family 2